MREKGIFIGFLILPVQLTVRIQLNPVITTLTPFKQRRHGAGAAVIVGFDGAGWRFHCGLPFGTAAMQAGLCYVRHCGHAGRTVRVDCVQILEGTMNEKDKFEARHQEIHDPNTGVTVTLGTHQEGKGHRWMRIARPEEGIETKTSTITFGPDGQALKVQPHAASPSNLAPEGETWDRTEGPDADQDPRAVEIKEELQHLDEVEASIGATHDETDKPDNVDKHHRRGKK